MTGRLGNWEVEKVGESRDSRRAILNSSFKGEGPLEIIVRHEYSGNLDRIEVHHHSFGTFLLTPNGLEKYVGKDYQMGKGDVPIYVGTNRDQSDVIGNDLKRLFMRADLKAVNAHPYPWLSKEMSQRIGHLFKLRAESKTEAV